MKLGISYSVFSGIELLPFAINQIREHSNFIIVNYQEYDWYGRNKLSEEDYTLLLKLKEEKIIDELYLFKINKYATNSIEAKILEKEKRNISRNICIENGCDYFLDCDTDEFYKSSEFKIAKLYLENKLFDYSYCRIIEYFGEPIYRRKNISDSWVPFICKIDKKKSLGTNNLNINIDPTRGYILNSNDQYGFFNPDSILMHHMTGIRKDLKLKYESSSMSESGLDRNNIDRLSNFIFNDEFEICENYFNISF